MVQTIVLNIANLMWQNKKKVVISVIVGGAGIFVGNEIIKVIEYYNKKKNSHAKADPDKKPDLPSK